MIKEIKLAELQHIPEILNILQQNLLSEKRDVPQDQLARTGFLINRFTADDITNAINDKENFIILITQEGPQVIAFATSCDMKKLNTTYQAHLMETFAALDKIASSSKVLYLRQIAKTPGKKSVGKDLLLALIKEAKHQEYQYIFSNVVYAPIENKVSMSFHEKMSFDCLGTMQQDNNVLTKVYLKKI